MPNRRHIKRHAERLVLSRFVTAFDNIIHAANYGNARRFGSTRDLQGVVRVVLLAQLEGRPLGISKIADVVDMPRATVERKLQALIELGMIERNGQRYQVPLSRLNDDQTMKAVERLIVMIHKTSEQLSRMGTQLAELPGMGTKTVDDY